MPVKLSSESTPYSLTSDKLYIFSGDAKAAHCILDMDALSVYLCTSSVDVDAVA